MNTRSKVSTQEAAELLEVDQKTISRWAKDGKLKAVKKNPNLRNSHYMIERAEIDRLLSERMTTHYTPKDSSQ